MQHHCFFIFARCESWRGVKKAWSAAWRTGQGACNTAKGIPISGYSITAKPGKAAGGSGPLGLGIQCQARADGFFPAARQLPPLVNLPPLGVQLVTMAAAPVPDARATRVEC